MNIICEYCWGKCCVGEIEVFPWDEIYSDPVFTVKVENNGIRDQLMKTDYMNRCAAFKGKKCCIYYKRPTVCREFVVDSPCCLNFKSGKLNKHSCEPCGLVTIILEKRKEKNESKRPKTSA